MIYFIMLENCVAFCNGLHIIAGLLNFQIVWSVAYHHACLPSLVRSSNHGSTLVQNIRENGELWCLFDLRSSRGHNHT